MNRKVSGPKDSQWSRIFYCVASLTLLLHNNHASAQVTPPAPYPGNAQVSYVRTWTATSPETNGNSIMYRPLKDVKQATQYLDGLGRPMQTVAKEGSLETGGLAADIVSTVVYDDYGREQYKYLPFISTANNGLFKYDPFQQQAAFMQAQYGAQGETFFYGKTNYELSPLNRPLKTLAPGNSWAGSERGVSANYWHNTPTDAVRIWNVEDVQSGFANYTTPGTYPAGVLHKNITADEHGKQIIEFKDKEGKVVLKKVQLMADADYGAGSGNGGWLCTYYIYDDLNNLRCVIQPAGVELLPAGSWQLSSDLLTEQCFRYEYDKRNRMIMKKVPGAGTVQMVYDARDRLVMTQDANLYGQGKWLVTKYDALNRPIETGLWTNSFDANYHRSYGYYNNEYPAIYGTYEILTITHYDNYAGLPAGLTASYITTWDGYFTATNNSVWPYPQMPQKSEVTTGLVTWTQTKVLGCSPAQYISIVNIYDAKGRVIQVQNINISDAVNVVTTQYNWTGQPLITVQKLGKAGSNAQTIVVVTKNSYDELGRVVKVEKKASHNLINGGDMPASYKTILQNEYDKLGQLKRKELGRDPSGELPLEAQECDYNIRGWLLGMNRDYAKDLNNSNYFGFDLGYDKANNNIIGGQLYNNPQYNGNIEGMVWKSKGDGEKRKYDFYYEAANRLLKADFTQYTGGTFNQSAGVNFSIKMGDGIDVNTAYDANGNIKQMQQWGWKLGGSAHIDNLTYLYQTGSNKLARVTENAGGGTPPTGGNNFLGDFKDGTNSGDDYTYDVNGNLTLDNNKAISSITYNHLNLPSVITVTGKGTITYTYDAAGNKIQKTVAETGQPVKTTLYIGGAVYENDVLQFITHEEGRIRFIPLPPGGPGWAYDYFLKDHLGNVRMVLTEEQKTDIYPAATMELATAAIEESYYGQLPETRSDPPAGYPADTPPGNAKVAKVKGNTGLGPIHMEIGPGILLKVIAGDQFHFTVNSWWDNRESPNPSGNPLGLNQLLAAINGSPVIQNSHNNGYAVQYSTELNSSVSSFLNSQTYNSSRPKAFVNWIVMDERFNYVSSNSGFEQIGAMQAYSTHTRTNMPVDKSGYLYIYLSNETPNIDVFFDNLQVTHIRGPLLEETHYYPFGLVQQGISSKALSFGEPKNKEKTFQGQRFDDDLGLNWVQFKWRNHDPQIGRFIEIDPLADKYVYNSTYAFSENKVTNHVELEGLEAAAVIWPRDVPISDQDKRGFYEGYNRTLTKGAIGVGVAALAVASIVYPPSIQYTAPLVAAEVFGVPSPTAPTSVVTTTLSETKAVINTVESEAATVSKGVDLTVKAKPTWNANQIAQAEAKVEALTNAETVVTKNPVARDANLRSKFKASGGQVGSTQHVDHVVDLQLGGTNATSNLQALDASVNTSLGKQLQLQMRNLPDNTRVNRVILELPPKKQ